MHKFLISLLVVCSSFSIVAYADDVTAEYDTPEYYAELEKAYSNVDFDKFTVEYVHENLNIEALRDKFPYIAYEEYATYGSDSALIGTGEYSGDTGEFNRKAAGALDETMTSKVLYDIDAQTRVLSSAGRETVTEKFDSIEKYEQALNSEFMLQKECREDEVLQDVSCQDDAVLVHTHIYFNGIDNVNCYENRYYYISVWDGSLLAINGENIVDGRTYEGFLITNFKYAKSI